MLAAGRGGPVVRTVSAFTFSLAHLQSTPAMTNLVLRAPLVVLFLAATLAHAEPADALNAGKKPALTPAEYKRLVLAFESCGVIGYSVDGKCQAVKDLQEAMKGNTTAFKDLAGMNASVGLELIGHASPAVRIKAANMMGGMLGTGNAAEEAITAAAEKEKDPGVMQALIRVVANSGAKNPKVAAMLLKSANHPDEKVRLQAVYAISSSWNREMKGGAEKLVELTEKDPSPAVRKDACEYGGALGNKVFLPVMTKLTEKTADKDLSAACMKGLVSMFHQYPFFETTDEGAYKLFLKRLNETPRTADRPYWTLTSSFEHAGDPKNEKLDAWKKATEKWFKAADVKKALIAILHDKNANWMARTGTVKSIVALGATKDELLALKKGVEDDKVTKVIDDVAAKL